MTGFRRPVPESDSDSDEEIQIKRYLNPGFKDGVIQPRAFQESLQSAKALQNLQTGVKRQPGHYQLRDCRHAVLESKYQGYQGKHWDVSTRSDLQRSTPRLTQHAIKKAIEQEQQLRSKRESQDRRKARSVYKGINDQFRNQLEVSKKHMNAVEKADHNKLELLKEDFQVELVREHNLQEIEQETEEERKHQIKLLHAMADQAKRTDSIESLVDGMTETNYKRSIINVDLEEANARLEEDEKEIDSEYNTAMGEMLDESLIQVTLKLDRDYLTEQAELSRAEKIKDLKRPISSTRMKTIHDYKNVQKNLLQAYQRVQQTEEKKDLEYKAKVLDLKVAMQEELVRKVARKWVDKAFSEEKSRRIQEAEKDMDRPNPARDAMLRLMTRVHRQMLLQKFKGKWINLVKKPKSADSGEADTESMSEQDRKLKQLRTRSRKESSVVRGDED